MFIIRGLYITRVFPQVLYIQAFLIVWQFVKFCKFLFFGALRAIEVEVSVWPRPP